MRAHEGALELNLFLIYYGFVKLYGDPFYYLYYNAVS